MVLKNAIQSQRGRIILYIKLQFILRDNMKTKSLLLFIPLIILVIVNQKNMGQNNQHNSPYTIVKPLEEKYQLLDFGDVKPAGWIKDQMEKDLQGFVGNLDQLVPDLIIKDDIYGKNRLTKKTTNKNVGNSISTNAEWEVEYLWWNSETQSNWWDGYIRNALLTDNKEHLSRIEQYIIKILGTQDENGYLGIYEKDLRYNFNNENGELWAKTTLLRGLLAYYEATKKPYVLEAVEKAVADVMQNYPIHISSPFKVDKSHGGICHGLMFTDVLDRLHQLTGNESYSEYALFLYKNYSENDLNQKDIQYGNIVDTNYQLHGHGVHTYEHLRSLVVANYASGNPKLKEALDIYLHRIEKATTPSGGPIGDEFIAQDTADASVNGYEYCSIHELLDSYASLLQKTGDAAFGDKIENLFFNAAQGARHPDESSIAYLKKDNCYEMMSDNSRYKYSPTHQDVAVCCVPNAGRITPYFVRSMWMKSVDTLVAALLGPCEVKTKIMGKDIIIVEETDYPFNYKIKFKISLNEPTQFSLKIRIPDWTDRFVVSEKYVIDDKYLVINKIWNDGDEVIYELTPKVKIRQDYNGEYYFTFGPLIYSLPIESDPNEIKKYFIDGIFPANNYPRDLQYVPKSKTEYLYQIGAKVEIDSIQSSSNVLSNRHFKTNFNSVKLRTNFINNNTGESEVLNLIPMSETILRQVTFKPFNESNKRK